MARPLATHLAIVFRNAPGLIRSLSRSTVVDPEREGGDCHRSGLIHGNRCGVPRGTAISPSSPSPIAATGAVGCGGDGDGSGSGGNGSESSAGSKSTSWDKIDRENYRIAKQTCSADKSTRSRPYRRHDGADDPYGYAKYYAALYTKDRRAPAIQGCLDGLGIKPPYIGSQRDGFPARTLPRSRDTERAISQRERLG
jgi:hypothetical protein